MSPATPRAGRRAPRGYRRWRSARACAPPLGQPLPLPALPLLTKLGRALMAAAAPAPAPAPAAVVLTTCRWRHSRPLSLRRAPRPTPAGPCCLALSFSPQTEKKTAGNFMNKSVAIRGKVGTRAMHDEAPARSMRAGRVRGPVKVSRTGLGRTLGCTADAAAGWLAAGPVAGAAGGLPVAMREGEVMTLMSECVNLYRSIQRPVSLRRGTPQAG